MDAKRLPEVLQKLLKKEHATTILVFIGIVGIALIYFSSWTSGKTEPEVSSPQTVNAGSVDDMQQRLEADLKRIVSAITGEEAEVMITLENGGETVYAVDERVSKNENSVEEERAYLIIKDSDGAQKGLAVNQIQPEIKGVVVVSKSSENALIREKLIDAVKTALGISSAKVCVICSP